MALPDVLQDEPAPVLPGAAVPGLPRLSEARAASDARLRAPGPGAAAEALRGLRPGAQAEDGERPEGGRPMKIAMVIAAAVNVALILGLVLRAILRRRDPDE